MGIPGHFPIKNGYTLKSSKKRTPRATRLVQKKLYLVLRDNVPGTPVNGHYAWLSPVFDCI